MGNKISWESAEKCGIQSADRIICEPNKYGYMECAIGRHLKDDEVVHHINHKRDDNRLSNLQLMTFKEHAALHMKERYTRRNDLSTK